MALKQAVRANLYLRCALFGPSGSGKTMSALRMAKGISEKLGVPFAVIDTEAGSASKYADRFSFQVDDLTDKTIGGYLKALDGCAEAGMKVVVIDSLSHAWRELTEEVDRIAQQSTSKNSFQAWGKVGPKQKALVDAILNYPGHIIACMRSKTEWVISANAKGKNAPEKVGLAPEQGKGIEYEFDLLVELSQNHQASVTKDRTGKFQDEVIDKPGEAFGVELLNWLSAGNAPATTPAQGTPASTGAKTSGTATQRRKTGAAADGKGDDLRAQGKMVMEDIGAILKTASPSGCGFFSEEEITEARQIISAITIDEKGLAELRDFRTYIAGELVKREPKPTKAAKENAGMRAA